MKERELQFVASIGIKSLNRFSKLYSIDYMFKDKHNMTSFQNYVI